MPAPRRGTERTVASDLASQVVIHRPNNFVSVHRYYTSAELLLRQVPPSPLTGRVPGVMPAKWCYCHLVDDYRKTYMSAAPQADFYRLKHNDHQLYVFLMRFAR